MLWNGAAGKWDAVVDVVPVGVRGDDVLVVAAGDFGGEGLAEKVRLLGGEVVLGVETLDDVSAEDGTRTDAEPGGLQVVGHGTGYALRGRGGAADDADKPATLGLVRVDDGLGGLVQAGLDALHLDDGHHCHPGQRSW